MLINLDNMDLYAGRRESKHAQHRRKGSDMCCALELGCFCVSKQGPSLLQEKCHLGLQVDRNLDTHLSHTVPDMSVRGTLSTLHGALDLSQYHIIRDLLSYNIGENIDDLPFYSSTNCDSAADHKQVGGRVWTLFSLQLDLLNVTLKLQINHGNLATGESESSLACINFIKSRLLCENFSNRTQDIDLVSQEILITDTRFQAEPVNKRSNVFTNILQPINVSFDGDIVQAELHHRRKPGKSKFTVLLNNMRLMSILDWWEAIRDFILEPDSGHPTNAGTPEEVSAKIPQSSDTEEMSFELKLNITDSEIVVVEDTSQWDSNAVILK
ncbi:unnamed protein product, partial [Timema podura]|nr:unnamed protein product [Timema podura]